MNKVLKKLNQVFIKIEKCKKQRTCGGLEYRNYYFEPNSYTIREWNKKGLYKDIDRRAMFVCESPGGLACPDRKSKNDTKIERCWDITTKDKFFFEIRKERQLENCYITNLVKCGVKKENKHTDKEIRNCLEFLKNEIKIIKPKVIIAVGKNVEQAIRDYLMTLLTEESCQLFKITHYSIPRNPKEVWKHEFTMLEDLINAKVNYAEITSRPCLTEKISGN